MDPALSYPSKHYSKSLNIHLKCHFNDCTISHTIDTPEFTHHFPSWWIFRLSSMTYYEVFQRKSLSINLCQHWWLFHYSRVPEEELLCKIIYTILKLLKQINTLLLQELYLFSSLSSGKRECNCHIFTNIEHFIS